MRRVTLKSITLCNFKGEKERTTRFNNDVTTISGGNGLGKSRHFDAFIWSLFGKDAQDRKDYEVKTRVDGEELHKAECSVTTVLDVDGETITLKRAFIEDWVKPRGQVEQRFNGNHTECWWNDTPVNVSEYDNRVKSIVDASVFKMITNPSFFAGMNWKLQREQLFLLAGEMSDAEIAAGNPDFANLLDTISGKSLADFKAEISARKKRLKAELDQVQPRIDQTYRMMPESEDFAGLDRELAAVSRAIADADESISDTAAAIRKTYEAEQARQKRIGELRMQLQDIEFKAKTDVANEVFERNAKVRDIERSIKQKRLDIKAQNSALNAEMEKVSAAQAGINQAKEEQGRLREAWFKENARVFDGSATCAHCGQPLPPNKILEARTIFANSKIEKCNEISEKGKRLGAMVEMRQKTIDDAQAAISDISAALATMEEELAKLQDEHTATPVFTEKEPDYTKITAWVQTSKEISDLDAAANADSVSVDTSELKERKAALEARREDILTRLAKRAQIAKAKKEVSDLEDHGKELGQQIADAEREEYTIQQFTKRKIEECERRINGLFKIVRFRLFDYTNDGNPVETCVATINGVPYGSANTASRVNAGLDIINALCGFYGVCAPIFIDNRESINEITPTESQIINLVVTNETTLTVQ